jgi:hypothetical protein
MQILYATEIRKQKIIYKNTITLHKCTNKFVCAYFYPGWTDSQLNKPFHKTSSRKSMSLKLYPYNAEAAPTLQTSCLDHLHRYLL